MVPEIVQLYTRTEELNNQCNTQFLAFTGWDINNMNISSFNIYIERKNRTRSWLAHARLDLFPWQILPQIHLHLILDKSAFQCFPWSMEDKVLTTTELD